MRRRRCGTVTGASMRDARAVHVFDLIPAESRRVWGAKIPSRGIRREIAAG
jgi:hypothetical protein